MSTSNLVIMCYFVVTLSALQNVFVSINCIGLLILLFIVKCRLKCAMERINLITYVSGFDFEPFLCTAVTSANFQSVGNVPNSKLFLNIRNSGRAITLRVSYSTLG